MLNGEPRPPVPGLRPVQSRDITTKLFLWENVRTIVATLWCIYYYLFTFVLYIFTTDWDWDWDWLTGTTDWRLTGLYESSESVLYWANCMIAWHRTNLVMSTARVSEVNDREAGPWPVACQICKFLPWPHSLGFGMLGDINSPSKAYLPGTGCTSIPKVYFENVFYYLTTSL